MKILWFIKDYPPYHNCGSDWYAHELNKFLISQGHEVTVVCNPKYPRFEFEGVKCVPRGNDYAHYFAKCDVIFTHLDWTAECIRLNERNNKTIFWFMHATMDYSSVRRAWKKVVVVYNSEYAKNVIPFPNNRSVVLEPPIKEINAKPGDSITLINISEAKGGRVLKTIAENMPDRKFIGVKGSYGQQVLNMPANVEIVENTSDLTEVYSRSRLVLMPSVYESWGMVGVEALSCGIPVLASDIWGLKESLGEAGIFLNRNKVEDWIDMIRKLDDKKEYSKASKKAKVRVQELKDKSKIKEFEEQIRKITGTHIKKAEHGNSHWNI